MANIVEGDYKDFSIKIVTPEDAPKILEHLTEVFYREELLFKLVGYTPELAAEVNEFVASEIAQITPENNLCFYAEDKRTKKVAGVRLTFLYTKADTNKKYDPAVTPQYITIHKFLAIMSKKLNVFDVYNVDEYVQQLFTCVAPEFRSQGLVTEFYIRSLRLIEARGFKIVKVTVSSPYTLRAVLKLGFQEVARFNCAQVKDEDGSRLFPTATEDQFCAIMIKSYQ